MKSLFNLTAIVALLILSLASCKKDPDEKILTGNLPVNPIYLDLSADQDNSVAYLKSVKLYWYEGGVKVYENQPGLDFPPFRVTYLPTATGVDSTRPLLGSFYSFVKCYWDDIHTFYLEYPDRATDELYMDCIQNNETDGSTTYSLAAFTINGKVPPVNPAYSPYNLFSVYLVQR